ncbi:hypothetical protein J6590_073224 [Homalodisca vitripennis]|nr:hypothetical protein J6590_073224 [Homalodisca vitripennis]
MLEETETKSTSPKKPTANGFLSCSNQVQINVGDYYKNVGWCPDIESLGAVPNLQVDDRYTKPRWSERLSHRGEDTPSTPPTGFFTYFWTLGLKWGYQFLTIKQAAKLL